MSLKEKIYQELTKSNTDVNKAKILPNMDSYNQFLKVEQLVLTGIENLEVSPALIELLGLTSKVNNDFLDEQTIINRLNEIRATFK